MIFFDYKNIYSNYLETNVFNSKKLIIISNFLVIVKYTMNITTRQRDKRNKKLQLHLIIGHSFTVTLSGRK